VELDPYRTNEIAPTNITSAVGRQLIELSISSWFD